MHIYGYGQLENIKIENMNEFQIFFGENEAGKSTIMAFIHGILFGFPTKQQAELRYEPKHNTKYGGKIRIILEGQGYAIIERVKGKSASGDVSVTMENGLSGAEELLKQLLSNMDKGLYQSIFSFNLNGLQNIHQMKNEDIGKFLFSAGALGSERLSITEIKLQKELDSRFKPGGKKPALNEKMLDLHQFHDELKKAAGKNQDYERLVEQQESVHEELKEIQGSLNLLQEKVSKLNEWNKIKPFVIEEKWVENEIKTLGPLSFPIRGVERYEKLNQHMKPYSAQISNLKERMEKINKERELLQSNPKIIEMEPEILATLDKFPLYDQLHLQQKQVESKLLEYDEKLQNIREKLHLTLNDDEILTINTNIYMKDQVEQLSRKAKALLHEKQQIDDYFNDEKKALEVLEERVRIAKTQVIPESERMELENQIKKSHDRKNVEMELKSVQEKIRFYKNMEEQERHYAASIQKQKQIQFYILSALFVGLVLYGIVTKQSILAILGGLCVVILVIFMFKNRITPKRKKTDLSLKELLAEEQRLVGELELPEHLEIHKIKEKLALDQRFREELKIQNLKLEQQNQQYEKVITKYEQWEWDATKQKEEIKKIGSQLKIPETIASSYLSEAFQYIDQYKVLSREKIQLQNNFENLKKEQNEIVQHIRNLADQFLPEKEVDPRNSAYLLRNLLKEQHEKLIQSKEKQAKFLEMMEDLEQLKQTNRQLEMEANHLLTDAKAENENEFYELGEKAELQAKLKARYNDIQKQLEYSFLNKEERKEYLRISDSDEHMKEYKQKMSALQTQQSRLQEQHASIKLSIQQLEDGGLYSELLHQFKQKKYELEVDAKEWAVHRLAQDILSQTVEKYKNIHLPRILTKAEEFLSFLTDGNYQKILLQPSGTGFLIERCDHTIFEANELSQATTEQVYVSIRLALALTLFEKFPFPIIIDDSFVNFDAKRTQKVMELLKQLKQNQILFFTCHAHLLEYYQKENILFLKKGAIQMIS
jgi:uncharacterized protein YhaN